MGEEFVLNVPSSVASRARQIAAETHRPIEDVFVELLDRAIEKPLGQALPHTEAELLQGVNLGLSEEQWERYHILIAKRRTDTLGANEQGELISLSDQIEQANARRIGNLIELAKLRHTSLDALMKELGIQSPPYV